MKIYFRLLRFTQPLAKRLIPYIIFTLFAVIFGLLNFTLLIPLLDILFGIRDSKAVETAMTAPEFTFSTDYFLNAFNYYFSLIVRDYGKFRALQFVCLSVVISVLLSNVFRYLSMVQMESIRTHTLINVRKTLFQKVTSFHFSYFSNERKGDIISRFTNDVNELDSSILNSIAVFIKEPLTLIVSFFALFKISASLTLFTLITIPLSATIISFFTKKLKRDSHRHLESLGRFLSILDESFFGIKIVMGFNAIDFVRNKFTQESSLLSNLQKKINLRKEMASPFSEFSGVLVVSFILLYGGSLVLANDSSLSASAFVAYIILFSQVLRPAKSISNTITSMQKGLVAGERICGVLDTPSQIVDKTDAITLPGFNQGITFKKVSFSYDDKKVLKDIDFTIEKGKMIALVGPSGGGKSTLADLLPRFYDPQEGQILIDGHDLRDITINSLRAQIGVVTQEAFLFNDTIYNNIVFGKENVTDADVKQAATIANAHEFIVKSDKGYDTIIGDRGVKLSGGQKQRITIARAILRNNPILILDEATSALDTESEKLVQHALDNLMKNRTSLVIAHRLSTIRHADMILVIKDGEIVEKGTHEELSMIDKGVYQKLSQLQK